MSELVEDLAICDAATDGPWELRRWHGVDWPENRLSLSCGNMTLTITPRYAATVDNADFEFMKHFNPLKIRQMLLYTGRLENALREISEIEDEMQGGDWDEIEEARTIANSALGDGK